MAAGGPGALAQHLHGSPAGALLQAVSKAIRVLASPAATRAGVCGAVAAQLGSAALARHVMHGSCSAGALEAAVHALGNLSGCPEGRAAVLAFPGSLPRLVQLLRGHPDVAVQATGLPGAHQPVDCPAGSSGGC